MQKQNWKKEREFYRIKNEEKKKLLYPTKYNFIMELKNNDYIHHLRITIPKLSFAAPYGSIGLLACSHIYSIIRERQPNLIIETGIGRGVTSTFILAALQKNGHGKLISIDKGSETGQLVFNGLRTNWDKRVGKTSDVLPTINEPVDIFLHDSLHTYDNMSFEFEWANQHLTSGLILSHDIGTNNSLYDFAKKYNKQVQYLPTTKNRYGVGVVAK
jgi:hypothetical protein